MDQMPKSPRQRQRGFSFRSDKSGSSKGKGDLTESPQEKARRDSIWKNSSKANPNAALSEAQPGSMYDPSLTPVPVAVALVRGGGFPPGGQLHEHIAAGRVADLSR